MVARIQVNGEAHRVGETCSVAELLEQLDIRAQRGVAVALNAAIVPRSEWPTTQLKDGDEIEILQAAQGG